MVRNEERICLVCNKKCATKVCRQMWCKRDMKQPQISSRREGEWVGDKGGGSQRSAKTADEKKGQDGIRTTRKQIVI